MWIKNDDTVTNTWVGQQITAGSYYEIKTPERHKWAGDSTLLKAIADGDAVVARDSSGNQDISDLAEAVSSLMDASCVVQKRQTVIAQDDKQTYETGTDFTATKTTTTDEDLAIDFDYLRGGLFECEDHVFPADNLTIKIVDVDNVLGGGAGTVVSTYVKSIPIRKDGIIEIKSESMSNAIPSGLYLRVSYVSTGTVNNVKCAITVYGYNDA